MGSDLDRLLELDREIEFNKPSVTLKYNEYKVQQGEQERLEDSELPENLDEDEVYDEMVKLHEEQRTATENRQMKAERVLQLMKIRDEIVDMKEKAQEAEWEAEMRDRKNKLERTQRYINRKNEEHALKLAEEKQQLQMLELQKRDKGQHRHDKNVKHTGEKPLTIPIRFLRFHSRKTL